MSEEQGAGQQGQEGADKSGKAPEGKAVSKEAAPKGGNPEYVSDLEGKLKSAEKALAYFSAIDTKYRSDEKFKTIFDNAWKGNYDKFATVFNDTNQGGGKTEEDTDDPIIQMGKQIDVLKKEKEDLKKSIDEVRFGVTYDKVVAGS